MQKRNSPTDLSQLVPSLALLGIRSDDNGSWDRLRVLQYQGLKERNLSRLIVSVAIALFLIDMVFDFAMPIYAALWFMAVSLSSFVNYYQTRQYSFGNGQRVTGDITRFYVLHQIMHAGLWTLPFLYLGWHGTPDALLESWAVTLALLMASALFFSSVPMLSIILIISITITTSIVFAQYEWQSMVLASSGVGIMLCFAAFYSAHAMATTRLAERRISDKEEVVSLLLKEFEETGADWLWQVDAKNRIEHASPRFAHALGKSVEQLEGKLFFHEICKDGDFASINAEKAEGYEKDTGLYELVDHLTRRKDSFSNLLISVIIQGEERWWELSASPITDESGLFLGFRGVGSDVTEEEKSLRKINQMARFDDLTGLPNRVSLTESVGQAMIEAGRWKTRCGFMMIDLDRFKVINDTLGHLVGDRLLAKVSKRLQAIMSDNEVCGRLGGDEFAIVLRSVTDERYVDKLAQKIIDTLVRTYEIDQHSVFIGASIGSAIGPRDGRTVEMLMRNADLALYQSKEAGGNSHTIYKPQLHVDAEERRQLEMALRKALEHKELSLHYQPVVDAHRGQISSFESLIRWHHPKFGDISPAQFIPIAEDARLISEIGEWVMRQACLQARYWPKHIGIAVNVSANQLRDSHFIEMVASALSEAQISSDRLHVEVTESLFINEGGATIKVLGTLVDMGIKLSLDDFGTGYSALGYLGKTRFSTIKIDRSFVRGAVDGSSESIAIIRAVVAMARSLGMATIAEGVEEEREVQMIRDFGCSNIQGYYFGRPMSPEESVALFKDNKRPLREPYGWQGNGQWRRHG